MSDIELLTRPQGSQLVKPAKGEMSDIELLERPKTLRLIKPAKGEMSDIELLERPQDAQVSQIYQRGEERADGELAIRSFITLIALSIPVRSATLSADNPR